MLAVMDTSACELGIKRGCDFFIFEFLADPTGRFFKTPTKPSS